MVAYGAPLSVVLTSGPDGFSRLRQAIRLSFGGNKIESCAGTDSVAGRNGSGRHS